MVREPSERPLRPKLDEVRVDPLAKCLNWEVRCDSRGSTKNLAMLPPILATATNQFLVAHTISGQAWFHEEAFSFRPISAR